jgi:hypothetical protein
MKRRKNGNERKCEMLIVGIFDQLHFLNLVSTAHLIHTGDESDISSAGELQSYLNKLLLICFVNECECEGSLCFFDAPFFIDMILLCNTIVSMDSIRRAKR